MVPYFAMPIVANSILGAKRAAYFFATWSVASVVFLLPLSLATALFASSSRDSDTYLDEFRVTLRYSTLACIAAVLGMALLGRPILHIFGTDYAENGYVPLIIMCLGGLGLIVKDHHVALARITGDVVREALTVGALSILELVGAAFGATHGGLTGLTLGWLAAATLGFVVYGPKVWRPTVAPWLSRTQHRRLEREVAVPDPVRSGGGRTGCPGLRGRRPGNARRDQAGPRRVPRPGRLAAEPRPMGLRRRNEQKYHWEKGSLQDYTNALTMCASTATDISSSKPARVAPTLSRRTPLHE